MKKGFYPKLALDGIRKNQRMYLPYLLTSIGMVMMYYIIEFLHGSEIVLSMKGGTTVQGMLQLGGAVIAIFSCIFLFYTNSFLLRRRKKEFGLYNMLGMGKRHLAVVLFWETLIVYALSLAAGLLGGIAFSKLAELGLVNVLRGEAGYHFSVSMQALGRTAAVFGVIFVLLFGNALRQIRKSTAIALLQSENVGEKPPKANWIPGLAGVVILIAAYAIAVSIQNPISALMLFFAAVVMVIVGTYLLMISGSVLLCRLLQKNKKYYYQPNHFVSVSSMAYRMKRNGAGLASVCILATMVLVMVSSTTSLYFGTEDVLAQRCPREMNTAFQIVTDDQEHLDGIFSGIRGDMEALAAKHGAKTENVQAYKKVTVTGLVNHGVVNTNMMEGKVTADQYDNFFMIDFIPLEDYQELTGSHETLEKDEVFIEGELPQFSGDTLTFSGGGSFRIKKRVDQFLNLPSAQIVSVITADFDTALQQIEQLKDGNGDLFVNLNWNYCFDTGLEQEEQQAFGNEIREFFGTQEKKEAYDLMSIYTDNRADMEEYSYTVNGAFLYLGIVLSIVFIFAAVLIIYYKQISEGYEDQARFEIMRKVGMTKKEIRRTINSQLLTVFFLPLILAGVHLLFAFPVIRKLLLLFQLDNIALFAGTTAGCFVVFAIFYGIVYRMTSNAYYKIVSGAKED